MGKRCPIYSGAVKLEGKRSSRRVNDGFSLLVIINLPEHGEERIHARTTNRRWRIL